MRTISPLAGHLTFTKDFDHGKEHTHCKAAARHEEVSRSGKGRWLSAPQQVSWVWKNHKKDLQDVKRYGVFRPAVLVLVYFAVVVAYGVYPFEWNGANWFMANQWHNTIAALAGLSFAFSNEPEDKAAMVGLVAYVLGLAVFDQLIPWAYGWAIILVGAVFIGWVAYIWRKSIPIPGEEETG